VSTKVKTGEPAELSPRLMHRLGQAAAMTNMGKTSLYKHIRAGHLQVVRIGPRLTLVTDEELRRFVAWLAQEYSETG
jgi:predicted DNA-binding transcriptional regulator AlpA